LAEVSMPYWKWYEDPKVLARTRAVLELGRAGHTHDSIAKVLNVSAATVAGDARHLKELSLSGSDPYIQPHIDLLLGRVGAKEYSQIDEAVKALEASSDPAGRYLADYFKLASRRLPEGSDG